MFIVADVQFLEMKNNALSKRNNKPLINILKAHDILAILSLNQFNYVLKIKWL